jgi:hypothetical protein
MKHFYTDIKGFMSDRNVELFNLITTTATEDFTWVELGSWTGKSAAYCIVELINKPLNSFKFYCVDTWEGAEEHQDYEIVKQNQLYDIFINNMLPVEQYYTPIKTYSHKAANDFKNNSVDFCYVDADHSYEGVMKDLEAWWPKIKSGCYFGGDDYTKGWPGVQKAVKEFFNKRNIKVKKVGRCWVVKKP